MWRHGYESGTACVNVCKTTTTLSAECRGVRSGQYDANDNAQLIVNDGSFGIPARRQAAS